MDALEIEKANVLGVFMGGMVAQEMALRHPDRVHRLILAGTYARPDAKRRMLIQQWRELSLGGASVEVMVRERLLWTLQDETLEQTDLIDQMIEFFVQDGAPLTEEVFARQCDACLGHDTADRLREYPPPHARDLRPAGSAHPAPFPPRTGGRDSQRTPRHDPLWRPSRDGRVRRTIQPHRAPIPQTESISSQGG